MYRKIESDMPVEEAYDAMGHKLHGSYKKANNDEPGINLFDKYGNKLDDTYKKVDSDGPSVELYDKNGNKLDGSYKKLISNEQPKEDLFDKDKNKLDDKYVKVLDYIKGDELYDKNGNKLDGKYVNILSDLPSEEIFDKKGNKLFGLFKKVEPSIDKKELYDKDGNKLDGVTLSPSQKSWVIPVATNKDGGFMKYSKVASSEKFDLLGEYATYKIAKECKEMLEGNIDISPSLFNKEKACEYCIYKSVCGFDPKFTENNYRKLGKSEDVWNAMKEAMGNGEGKGTQDLTEGEERPDLAREKMADREGTEHLAKDINAQEMGGKIDE